LASAIFSPAVMSSRTASPVRVLVDEILPARFHDMHDVRHPDAISERDDCGSARSRATRMVWFDVVARTSCISWKRAGRISSTRIPELVKQYVKDITAGLKMALANRDETMKVVSEITKAPIPVLDSYLLKQNDFAREPGGAPNFAGIQAMFDVYTTTDDRQRSWMRRC